MMSQETAHPNGHDGTDGIPTRIGAKTLFRIGGALILLAVVFLFRYSIEQGWIGPAARVAAGYLTGVALVAIGLRIAADRPAYGTFLQGIGVAALFVTAYAGWRAYGYGDPMLVLIQFLVVAAGALWLAERADDPILATVGLVGALVAPLLVPVRDDVVFGTSLYLGAVLGVSATLAWRHDWVAPHAVAGIVATPILLIAVFDTDGILARRLDAQLAAAVWWLASWVFPVVARRLGRRGPGWTAFTVIASAIVSLVAYLATLAIWQPELGEPTGLVNPSAIPWALVALALGAVHLGAALALIALPDAEPERRIQVIPATFFAIVAPLVVFGGPLRLVMWTALGLGLVLAGDTVRGLREAGNVILAIAAVAWVGALTEVPRVPFLTPSGLAMTATVIAVAVGAWLVDDPLLRRIYGSAAYIASLVLAVQQFAREPGWQGFATALWAAIGAVTLVVGTLRGVEVARWAGSVTLVAAAAKLLLVDLAAVEPIWRILLLAGVGVLLTAIGYWAARYEPDADGRGAPKDATAGTIADTDTSPGGDRS